MARNKYNAKKVTDDGYTFDSKAEHRRYCELKILRKAKEIEGLVVHPVFFAIVNDTKICKVELDFQYFDKKRGMIIYEDVKSKATYTAVSRLKHKLIEALFPSVKVELVWT